MQKEIIEDFSKLHDKKTVQGFYNEMLDCITLSLNKFNSKVSIINRLNESYTKIFPIGEYTNDTYIDDNSELEIMIASCDPQLISLNASFSESYKNSKNKRNKATIVNDGSFDKIIELFAECLTEFFPDDTPILIVNEGIKILSSVHSSHKVLIRFATYHENDEKCILSFWNVFEKTVSNINLFSIIENMDKKDNDTLGNYKKIVRVYKNIRKNILIKKQARSSDFSKYLVELMIYNIPNNLLTGNEYEAFTKSINYLTNANLYAFKDFEGKNISNFPLVKVSYSNMHSFINLVQKNI